MDDHGGAQKVRIVVPRADGPARALGTRIFMDDGREVHGVFSVKISELNPSEIITAQIELALDGLEIEAHPLVGRNSLARAAEAHGLRLVDANETAQPVEAGLEDWLADSLNAAPFSEEQRRWLQVHLRQLHQRAVRDATARVWGKMQKSRLMR